jgi:hypothetical protein
MKWLKHMTASWDDEKLAALVGEGGDLGLARYGLYWRINEIIARQMEGKTPSCSVRYPVTRWSLLLSLRGSLVFSKLSRLAVTGLVTVERDGSDIIVTNCNLLKYRDEYSKKSGHSPVQEGDTEGDTDTEGEAEAGKEETAAASPVVEVGVFELPLPKNGVYQVPQSLYREYVEAYPGVSVMGELAAMRSWLLSNRTKMKTVRGMPAFMNSWLNRSQNSNGGKVNANTESVSDRIRRSRAAHPENRVGGGVTSGDARQGTETEDSATMGAGSGGLF